MRGQYWFSTAVFAGALLFIAAGVGAAECTNRGDLDVRYCDENGDLVADTPTDSGDLLDPDVLVFSYTPVEDPAVYENVFTEFMDYLAEPYKQTRKNVGTGVLIFLFFFLILAYLLKKEYWKDVH